MTEAAIRATIIQTSLGVIHLALGDRGLVAVTLDTPRAAFEADIARRFGRPPVWLDDPGGDATLADAASALVAAAAGDDAALAALPIDLGDRPAWDRAVLVAVRAIPRGETRGYGEVARAIGRPGAARAVGGAVGRNPLALVIPCHRVIAGDGTLGGYGGGWWGEREHLLERKASLLAGEGRIVRRRDPFAPRSP